MVNTLFKNKALLLTVLCICISYCLRIIFISNNLVMPDEAHYYIYSKNLPFGFYDHPSGVGFFIRFFTAIFGENAFGLRVGGIISMILVSWYMYYFYKRHFTQLMATISVLLFNMVVLFQGLTFIITIDTPFFFSLVMTIMLYYDAIYNDPKYFYGAGFFLGFTLLSKEAAVLAIIPYTIYFIVYHRPLFLKKEFYFSLLIMLLIYSPFIIFIFQSNFAPIHFMSVRIPRNETIDLTIIFWLSQLLFITPLFFIIFIFKTPIVFFKNLKQPRVLYFAVSSFIILLYFINLSINRYLELNWALVMYAGGIFIVAQFISDVWNNRAVQVLFFINSLFSLVLISIFILNYYHPITQINEDPINRYYDFQVFTTDLKDYYEKHMDKSIPLAGAGYDVPSLFDFYIKPKTPSIMLNWYDKPNSSYEFFKPEKDYLHKNVYYLLPSSNIDSIKENFSSYQYLQNFVSYRNGKPIKTWYLFLMEDLTNIRQDSVLNQKDWFIRNLGLIRP